MKKINYCLILIMILLIFGCDYQIQNSKNKQQVRELSIVDNDFQSFLLSSSGMGDLARKSSLIDIYYNYVENEDYSAYEVFIDYDKQSFIGIYMDSKTIEKIKKYMVMNRCPHQFTLIVLLVLKVC